MCKREQEKEQVHISQLFGAMLQTLPEKIMESLTPSTTDFQSYVKVHIIFRQSGIDIFSEL